jgi:[ribosomal protein S5]-alanine N-acetyltransferase
MSYKLTHPHYAEFDGQIKVGRLQLVEPAMRHAPASFEWVSDPVVIRLMGAETFTPSLAGEEERIRKILADEEAYHWIIEVEGRAVGNINLHDITETSQRFKVKAATFAILLGDQRMWGKGVGTAATQAVLDWAFRQAGFGLIAARALTQNLGSIRLLEKSGFVFVGTEPYDGPDLGEPALWQNYEIAA